MHLLLEAISVTTVLTIVGQEKATILQTSLMKAERMIDPGAQTVLGN